MIDTIKLVIKYNERPHWITKARFQWKFDVDAGTTTAYKNPSRAAKQQELYQPRLTYYERPISNYRKQCELAFELSLPKLLYKNNFNEISDKDFDVVVDRLIAVLRPMGIWLFRHQVEQAEVRKIDFCKNIIFTDYTSVSSILKDISSANISKIYDVQKTDFRNGGHIFHIHTNSLDIAIYDKIADLRQSKISEKRSIEKDNYIQLSLLDELERLKRKPLAVARLEVRLNSKAKIRDALNKVGIEYGLKDLTFKNLYSSATSKKLLLSHWQKIIDGIPKVPLDTDTPEKLFAEILKEDNATPRSAFARLGYLLLVKDQEPRYIRNLLEEKVGKHAWNRLKDLRAPPNKTRLKNLLAITDVIEGMKPVDIADLGL